MKDLSKEQIAEWWSKHPQDYVGWNAPSEINESNLSTYLQKADDALRRDHFDLHEGNWFFSRLIPYPQLRGKRVLEVGCGLGAVSDALARAGAKVSALDLSELGLRATRWRMHVNGLQGQVIRGDAEKLPFSTNMFDFVWSWGVIHHTPNTVQAVSEIYRVLRPGGSACVMFYHRHGIYAYLNILLRRGILRLELLRKSTDQLLTRYSDGREFGGCPLAQYFSKSQALEMFKMFSQVSISTHGYLKGRVSNRLGVRWIVDTLLPDKLEQFLMSRYGHFLIIQATK